MHFSAVDIALEVLDKCTVEHYCNTHEVKHYTHEVERHVAFNFEFLEPFKEKGLSLRNLRCS